MFKDESGQIVPAIVSEELWEQANAILRRRSDDVKSRQGICNHANLLTGKLYCTCCGTAYYRRESTDRHGNQNSRWVCSGKIKNGADSCPSFPIYEEEIKPLLLDVARDTKVGTEALIEEYIQRFQSLDSGNQIPKLIAEQKTRKELAQKKKSKLLEYNVTGAISDDDFITMNKQCVDEIADAETQIQELEQQQYSREEFQNQIDAMKATMRSMEQAAATGAITKQFVDEFIDKILVTPDNDRTMRLDIKIFTGEVDALNGIAVVETREIEIAVDFLNLTNLLIGEVATAKTDGVDSGIGDRFATSLHIGWNILVDESTTLHHHMLSDVGELVNERSTANDCVIVDNDLTSHLHGIRHDYIVANNAVVCHMAISHNETVAADYGLALRGSTSVDSYALANCCVVANYSHSVLATEL